MIVTDISELKKECEDVLSANEAFSIIEQLDEALSISKSEGIGLAANQIGINKKVCILRIPQKDHECDSLYSYQYNIANPKIISKRFPFIMKNEGCLSFPGETIETLRYASVTISDLLHPDGRTLVGLAAVVAQHEIDHVYGGIMHDRQLKNINPNQQCPCENNKLFKYCCAITMRTNSINSR